ncbi:hypothetical protein JQX08_19100 [Pseudomonas sp. UL073]|uniref:Uncharacterized protein n=1 Tax=Zestomonas insulae TaxID=2809017 RepID=A0ABS2ILE7_9GAMM|nr:hypothetical protein [Pseudomonas insulae]MBM7062827.1 hypothetical protein [Pseudomonas insulae]
MKNGHPISKDESSRAHGNSSTEAATKIARILAHLLTGASTNRFEAEGLGDHCLNSTIAILANRHGLTFGRQSERVPNRWGQPCLVTRYSLPASEQDKARKVLDRLSRPSRSASEE